MNDALLRVATGFKLILYGMIITIVSVAVLFVGACLVGMAGAAAAGPGGRGNGPPGAPMAAFGGMMILMVIFAGLWLLGAVLGLIGRVMCLAVPPQAASAKSLITIAVVMELGSVGANLFSIADNVGGNFLPPAAKLVLSGVTLLGGLLATILFLLFTRSLAKFIRSSALASRAMLVMWLGVAAAVCYLIAIVTIFAGMGAMMAGGGPGGAGGGGGAPPAGPMAVAVIVGGLLSMLALLIALVGSIFYVMLLVGMSSALRTYVRRRRSDYDDEDYSDDEDYDDENYEDEDYDRPRRRARDDEYDDGDDRPRRRDRDDYDDDDRKPWDRPRR
ncbi:hypothetical protein GobsT_22940 [Gemmata obscuriglobus]|uniref:Uncharacterized protein n=1 Tax=Gemmata obscuriglobus TaxID=114 RepID=A0A2Z3H0X9_9BACT|nr:hypothetical protein [Gemmata obscuriglobus]AWM39388.1 hypothetical protein C1280_21975 [Gemmata obscuriglobus]QEG27538.1 hypothetical protein GobsT_22940 [Gemmata obscuriglobus]VTS04595.1 unnamed protein product [Gemmata obscuriglobus UQM 2246]